MRQIITFLGTIIKPTTYRLGETDYTGRVFAEALLQFVEFDRMLVCATARARETTWPVLESLNDPRIICLNIETGHDSTELWRIFDTLTGAVNEGDAIIFDITHGLRSLPFLVFLAAAYVKAAKQVTIEAIYYGAYELGQPAPIIDLSEFVTLLDWLAAADRFTQIGDGRPLANLLRDRMPPGLAMRDDLDARALGHDLKLAASAIEQVSLALSITRPLETMEAAAQLGLALQQTHETVTTRARPFALLAEKVHNSYAPFSLAVPLDRANWPANLRLQLAMIRWYVEKGQIVQAATLAREWLVSLVAYRVGAVSLVDLDNERFPIEGALNNQSRRRAGKEVNRPSPRDADVAALPALDDLIAVWSKVTNLRNDIAHVGMNEQPKSASTLYHEMTMIFPELERLSRALLPAEPGGK